MLQNKLTGPVIKAKTIERLERVFFIHNSGVTMVGTEFIRSILFILPLGVKWMEWRSVQFRNMNAE